MSRRVRHDWFLSRVHASRRQTTKRRAPTLPSPFHRRLRLEPLEDRRLLAVVTVDTLDDTVDLGDGVTSLREAIIAANTMPGADTIDFASSLTSGGPATITLKQGELSITTSLAINGPGANLLTIDASGNDPTPDSTLDDGDATNDHDGSRVFNIDDVNTANVLEVRISGLTLTGGDVGAEGGAIRSRENLTVTDSTISGNSASGSIFGYGGGIRSFSGTLIVTHSTLSNNSVSGSGGAISQSNGSLTIANSMLNGNSATREGGGIRLSLLTTSSLTIANSTISGNSSGGDGGGMRLSGGSAFITDSMFSGNLSGEDGGAISKGSGHLTVTRSTFAGNSALGTATGGYGRGGGIWSGGYLSSTLTIAGSTFSGNSADGASSGFSNVGGGGGIWASDSQMVVTDSTISGNSTRWHGGGILKFRGKLMVMGSTISDNAASGSTSDGGGMYIGRYSTMLTLAGSTISGNSAGDNGGGIYGRGGSTVTVNGSTIGRNSAQSGGGISSFGNLVVKDSLLQGNTAGVGGGIRQFDGAVSVTNSTISGNMAVGNGGAFYLFTAGSSVFTIRHSTIVSNTASGFGGGISVFGGSLDLDHTIVAQNTAALGRDLIPFLGAVVDARFNLIGDNANSGLAEAFIDAKGNRIGGLNGGVINPMLAPLGSNGGLTMTHALLAGSRAIDGGEPSVVAGADSVPHFDQRGAPFERIFGNRIDIGAFERQTAPGSLVVDTLFDESDADYSAGDLSLREAVELANGYAGADVVEFAAALTATGPAAIMLSQGELAITESLIVDGPGAELLTIDASASDPTPNENNGDGSRIFNINDGLVVFFPDLPLVQDVVIRGLTLTGGDLGGAINNAEHLTIERTSISGNSATGAAGGITTSGDLTVTSSTISGNSTSGDGGGIRASYGNLVTITDSLISGNTAAGYGGGVSGYKTDFTITRSTISHNSAGRRGGGVSARMGDSGLTLTKTVTITDSTIGGNSAGGSGGGVSSSSLRLMIVTITNCTISGNTATNRGGGVYMRADGNIHARTFLTNCTITDNAAGSGGGAAGIGASTPIVLDRTTVSGNTATGFGGGVAADRLVVENSTISGNTAADGGGVSSGHTWITGSTISNNSTAGNGGGILHGGGYLSIYHSTIADNSAGIEGGGVKNFDAQPHHTMLTHTIVARNLAAGLPSDFVGFAGGSSDYNLIGVETGLTGITHGSSGNQLGTAGAPINALMGSLADNGGPTMTHALLPGSPAIDTGNPSFNPTGFDPPMYNDQRGAPFGRIFDGDSDGGARIDIGAFELQPIPAAFFGDFNGNGSVDAADYVVWRKTLGGNVAPYSGADGNGNGIVDQGDHIVWRAHFWQMIAAGSGATTTALSNGTSAWPPSASLEGELVKVLSMDRDAGGQTTSAYVPIAPAVMALVTPAATHQLVGARSAAETVTARRDDALVAWLAAQREPAEPFDDLGAIQPGEHDSPSRADGATIDFVDECFALLAND